MHFYDKHILPRLTHMAMCQQQLAPYRHRAVSAAEGRVVEIGIGSGLNLPFYSDKVARVVGIDPSAELLRRAADTARGVGPDVELIEGWPRQFRWRMTVSIARSLHGRCAAWPILLRFSTSSAAF